MQEKLELVEFKKDITLISAACSGVNALELVEFKKDITLGHAEYLGGACWSL